MNRELLQHYTRFHYHRCNVLEGVRVAAFRNIDHLSRVMAAAGIDKLATESSIAAIQDTMLRDQGLEPTPTRRWLLGCGLSNTWEVYLCLLFAEIESYQSNRALFAFPALDEFITINSEILNSLKAVRDKLLHPEKEVVYDEALSGFFGAAERRYPQHLLFGRHGQVLIDRYLKTLKEHLVDVMVDEIARLPDEELWSFIGQDTTHLRKARNTSESKKERSKIEELIRGNDSLPKDFQLDVSAKNASLNRKQRRKVNRLLKVKRALVATLLPADDYRSSPEDIQTPMHEKLSSFIPSPTVSGDKEFFLGRRLPAFLEPARRDYVTLVFRSILLFNESYQYLESILNASFPGMSHSEILSMKDWPERLWKPRTPEDYRRAERGISPSIVALALLTDPLRVYRRVVAEGPELKVPAIDEKSTRQACGRISSGGIRFSMCRTQELIRYGWNMSS